MASTEVDVLYGDLGGQFDATRAKELRALEGKSSGLRKLTNEGVADAVLASLGDQYRRTLTDFLRAHDEVNSLEVPEGEVEVGTELPGIGSNPMGSVAVDGVVVDVGGREQAEWVRALSECGIHGSVPVPVDPAICRAKLAEFDAWRLGVTQAVADLIAQQTDDTKRTSRIQQLIVHRILRPSVS